VGVSKGVFEGTKVLVGVSVEGGKGVGVGVMVGIWGVGQAGSSCVGRP
jgi:hypothetical protein